MCSLENFSNFRFSIFEPEDFYAILKSSKPSQDIDLLFFNEKLLKVDQISSHINENSKIECVSYEGMLEIPFFHLIKKLWDKKVVVDRLAVYITDPSIEDLENNDDSDSKNDGDENFFINTNGLFLKYEDFEEIPNLDSFIGLLDKPQQLTTVFICGPDPETVQSSFTVLY